MEILNRLPVRSLLRFKCISKFWKALISDPYFKMKHLNCAKNDQDFQKLLIMHWCRADNIVSLYYCPLSSVQLVENSQKLDIPSKFKPTLCGILCCYNGLDVIEIAISRNSFVVVSFSISNKVYKEIPLPEEMLRLRVKNCIRVSVLDGMLYVDLDSVTQRNDTSKLWVLKDYGVKGSWMQLLTIKDPLIYKIVPKYRFADVEVLFCCLGYEWKGRAFRTASGPFVSWP
ncbi:putative F-box protein CPR30-like isoform X4 [Capsicum annuum]|nr:putative F-box protein CPR30-like isoform X4 [Capsicum annuum]